MLSLQYDPTREGGGAVGVSHADRTEGREANRTPRRLGPIKTNDAPVDTPGAAKGESMTTHPMLLLAALASLALTVAACGGGEGSTGEQAAAPAATIEAEAETTESEAGPTPLEIAEAGAGRAAAFMNNQEHVRSAECVARTPTEIFCSATTDLPDGNDIADVDGDGELDVTTIFTKAANGDVWARTEVEGIIADENVIRENRVYRDLFK